MVVLGQTIPNCGVSNPRENWFLFEAEQDVKQSYRGRAEAEVVHLRSSITASQFGRVTSATGGSA